MIILLITYLKFSNLPYSLIFGRNMEEIRDKGIRGQMGIFI